MPPSSPNPQPDPAPARRPRGERFWQSAAEPIFLLSGQRRLLYANPAWERLTGVAFAEARGRLCRRRSAANSAEPLDHILAALAPPPEIAHGRSCQLRRRAPGPRLSWWEIDFFPWSDASGPAGVLGKIRVIQETGPAHDALPEKLVQLRARAIRAYRLDSWTSTMPVMQRLIAQMRLAGQTRLPALILGPPGSGKTWAARTVHQLGEGREGHCAVLDACLPAATLAELFAVHRAGRVETVYLSRLERLPRDAQALLVQRLDTETVDTGPRLLAGSTVNLDDEVRAGRLLPELLCQLSPLTLHLPALADRRPDLPQLVHAMLPRAREASGQNPPAVTPAALELFGRYSWPENLRELYRVLVSACGRAESKAIDVDDLPFYLRNVPVPPEKIIPLDETLEKVERRLLELAVRLAQGNKTRAAELLAIWRPRLLRRLEQLGQNPV